MISIAKLRVGKDAPTLVALLLCAAFGAHSAQAAAPAHVARPAVPGHPAYLQGNVLRNPAPRAQPVDLGSADSFIILTKSGITDVPSSSVVGNVGTSPITGAADHLTCTEVTGHVHSVDAAGPAPCSIASPILLTVAVSDMQNAYAHAAARPAGVTELGGGNIGGLTIGPGVYKWSTGVSVPATVTLTGGPNDVWVFEISQNLVVSNGQAVVLTGGAQAKNVFWQVGGQATLGTTSHFQGIILSKTLIALQTGATVNGRLYAQTAVTLQQNSVSIH